MKKLTEKFDAMNKMYTNQKLESMENKLVVIENELKNKIKRTNQKLDDIMNERKQSSIKSSNEMQKIFKKL